MRSLKSVFGGIGVLMPVFYCGSLLYYFLDLSGSVHEAWEIGLGPTVLGLGAVGLLFCIPLILKVVRIFARPRSPGSGGPDAPAGDDKGGFDVDAAIARYLTQRFVEAAPSSPAAPPARQAGARRSSFGRKTG